ncbi:hypothetical protein SAMN05443634_1213 [Chishuiella changwenlii]|uniref:Uncharacterized protein n=1 Tax=Chishuiella changwenlii TaxID=1434701 RepID=A0A1M7D8D0_9FLAO|nr:hypothetical protein [Chishuiella changwenlii]GGF11580.1 hypothetical protein GCM10010984_30770 [Chishuiella changwenlii]SHL75756.1 hypothetical protein SAMN05443634_1213 [Chishuiella changwenlii]
MKKYILSINFIRFLVLLEILFSYYFFYHTEGLFFEMHPGNFRPVTEIQSSGNDEDIAIGFVMIVYTLLFLLLLFNWNKKILFYLILFFFVNIYFNYFNDSIRKHNLYYI